MISRQLPKLLFFTAKDIELFKRYLKNAKAADILEAKVKITSSETPTTSSD